MLSDIWHDGKGIAESIVDSNGKLSVLHTAVLGNGTIFLLEGEVEILSKQNNFSHTLLGGYVIGLTTEMEMQWISKGLLAGKV